MTDSADLERLKSEHDRLAHALQAAARFVYEHQLGRSAQVGSSYPSSDIPMPHYRPHDLRTGINMEMCLNAGMVRLLLAKGVFTEEEYFASVNGVLQEELARYEAKAAELLGSPGGITFV